MPRIRRGLGDNQFYHVINRGNARNRVFHKSGDYLSFIDLMEEASARYPVKLFNYCLMPNHFHFVAEPQRAQDLSCWMQWLMTSHVRRYHAHYASTGHVWQGRFKSFLIEEDSHLVTVARYVEANPVRASLALSSAAWPWSSHAETVGVAPRVLTRSLPVDLPDNWTQYVDTPMSEAELEKMRRSAVRQMPYGDEEWQARVSLAYHLESTLHPLGRPRKESIHN